MGEHSNTIPKTLQQSDPEADLAYQQSVDLLNDAIKDCQLNGFQVVESNIPQVFNQQGKITTPLNNPPDFMSLAKQAFEQPASLFAEGEIAQQELTGLLSTENELNTAELNSTISDQNLDNSINNEGSQPSSEEGGLDAINNLLNSG
mgnify:CR=1 FL=1